MESGQRELKNNTSFRRFELWVDGSMATLEYELQGHRIALVHTEVPAALAGKGIGAVLVKKALECIAEKGYRVIPGCPYVNAYMKKHQEWNRLLEHGIHL